MLTKTLENAHKFQKKGHTDIIHFMYEGKKEIQVYAVWSLYDCLYEQDSKSKKGIKMAAI